MLCPIELRVLCYLDRNYTARGKIYVVDSEPDEGGSSCESCPADSGVGSDSSGDAGVLTVVTVAVT